MKKLLLIASLAIVGTMSAKNGEIELKSSKDIKGSETFQKIEIKLANSQAILQLQDTLHCFDYNADGKLVEVKCPPVIIETK